MSREKQEVLLTEVVFYRMHMELYHLGRVHRMHQHMPNIILYHNMPCKLCGSQEEEVVGNILDNFHSLEAV